MGSRWRWTQSKSRLFGRLLLVGLALPLAWPAIHGVAGVVLSMSDGRALAGGGRLWPDGRVAELLLQGLGLALACALLSTIVGAVFAGVQLFRLHPAARLLLVGTLTATFCFGTVVHLLAWRTLFPLVTGGVAGWGLATVILALRYAPLAAALLLAGMLAMDRTEFETALVAGGSRAVWRVGRGRLMRLGAMSVAAVSALVFGESELPPLLGVHVYAEEFLSQVALEPDTHTATALGWPLMAVAATAAAALAHAPRLNSGSGGALRLGWVGCRLHTPRRVMVTMQALALLLALLPLLLLLGLGAARSTGRWPAQAVAALGSSIWVAVISALLAVAWGWMLSELASRSGKMAGRVIGVLAWLLMLWPSALTALAIGGLGIPDAAGSATPLVLAHTLRLLPFSTWILLALRELQPLAPKEQLRVIGARGWKAWRHVALPAAAPGLLTALTICVGLSLAELTATVLTVPAGMETVVLRLYNLLHYGDERGVMTLALLQGLLVAGVALALAAMWGTLRLRQSGGRDARD